jgi:hypothetical protein
VQADVERLKMTQRRLDNSPHPRGLDLYRRNVRRDQLETRKSLEPFGQALYEIECILSLLKSAPPHIFYRFHSSSWLGLKQSNYDLQYRATMTCNTEQL